MTDRADMAHIVCGQILDLDLKVETPNLKSISILPEKVARNAALTLS